MGLGGGRGIRTHGSRWVPGATIFKSGPNTPVTWAFVLESRLSPRIPRGLPCIVGHGWTDSGAAGGVRGRRWVPPRWSPRNRRRASLVARPHDFSRGPSWAAGQAACRDSGSPRRSLVVQVGVGPGLIDAQPHQLHGTIRGPTARRPTRSRPGPRPRSAPGSPLDRGSGAAGRPSRSQTAPRSPTGHGSGSHHGTAPPPAHARRRADGPGQQRTQAWA